MDFFKGDFQQLVCNPLRPGRSRFAAGSTTSPLPGFPAEGTCGPGSAEPADPF